MTRRGLTIWLHWGVVMMILAMIKGGSSAEVLRWAFVLTGAVWVGLAVVRGLLGRPGPKLTGAARAAYPWMHRGLYGVLAISVAANGAALMGWVDKDAAWNSLLVLLAAGAPHGLFHFWRHTALYDGALRLMSPRFMHRLL